MGKKRAAMLLKRKKRRVRKLSGAYAKSKRVGGWFGGVKGDHEKSFGA
jgi:hypothetical protein